MGHIEGNSDVLAEVSAADFRETFGHFATGVIVITALDSDARR